MNHTNELSNLNHAVEIASFTTLGVVATILNLMIILTGFDIYDRAINTSISINLAIANTFASAFLTPIHGQGDTWLLNKDLCRKFLTVHAFWRTLSIGLTMFATTEAYMQIQRHYKVLKITEEDEEATNETNNERAPDQQRGKHRKRAQKTTLKSSRERMGNKYYLNVKLTTFLIWGVSAAISFMTFVSISVKNKTLCSPFQHVRKELVYLFMVFVIIIPSAVMCFLNIKFWRLSVKYPRTIGIYGNGRSQYSPSSDIRADLHNAKISFRMFQFLLLSWLPYTAYMLCIMSWEIDILYFDEIAYKAVKSFQWFSYASVLFQAIIIVVKNKQISLLISNEIHTAGKALCGENYGKTRENNERNNEGDLSPSPGLRRKYIENECYKESTRVDIPCYSSSTNHTDMPSTSETPTSYEKGNRLNESDSR